MPPHPSYDLEKSPVDAWDYEGLQLDTRAKENLDKTLDDSKPQGFMDDDFDDTNNYLNEKQAHRDMVTTQEFLGPGSPDSAFGPTASPGISPLTPGMPNPKKLVESVTTAPGSPPPLKRRICGLRPRHFWELFALALMVVITAAIIGGVVGGLKTHRGSSPAPASTSAPQGLNTTNTTQPFVAVHEADVRVDSALCVVTYDEGPPESFSDRQAFRLYFQSAYGNIKESTSYHLESWSSALPIFTDAANGTGLATVTYLNPWGSQVGSLFYVGSNGFFQEKRKIYNDTGLWEPGTLNNYNIAAVRNISIPTGSGDPENNWDSYQMAAAYSKGFHSGPGTRFFYHTQELNGTSYVQELIWYQGNDSWAYGSKLFTPWPNSHLAVTIDNSTNILRLFFSSGHNTLQEMWMSLTDPNSEYRDGLTLENYLAHDNADIAAISLNGTTYLYHYAALKQTAQAGIHEIVIKGTPGSVNNQEAYNLSSPLVVSPQLTTNDKESSYQPLAVTNTAVPGLDPAVYVFWADKISGDPETTDTGYTELAEISRPFRNSTWPSAGQIVIDLGNSNSDPSR